MIEILGMFWSNFFVVLLLGLQSKNVQKSHYALAMITSFGISISQAMFVKYIANGSQVAFFVCALGGAAGIATSIWLSDNWLHKKTDNGNS